MDGTITLFTVGFTKKTAEQFFTRLQAAGVKRVIDVRLNNVSQLAGFSKKDDLKYFLRAIGGIDYLHVPQWAPTQDILDAYKKHKGDWSVYETEFNKLLAARHAEEIVPKETLDRACLLCSEDEPLHCHRRLVAEYLQGHWGNVVIEHIA